MSELVLNDRKIPLLILHNCSGPSLKSPKLNTLACTEPDSLSMIFARSQINFVSQRSSIN